MVMISSLFKHLITEADKITLSIYCSHKEQGIYALTNNYGSLVARLIYLPLEDSTRLSFAKIASELRDEIRSSFVKKDEDPSEPHSTTKAKTNSRSKAGGGYSNSLANEQLSIVTQEKLKLSLLSYEIKSFSSYLEMQDLFLKMIRLICFLGITIALFGPYYVEIIVHYLFKSQWRTIEIYSALQYYCYYLALLGINGITEAVLQSTIDQNSSYLSLNLGLLVSSIVFFVVSLSSIPYYGTIGIIFANIAAMAIRIGWNSYLIYEIFENPIKEFFEFRGMMALVRPKSNSNDGDDNSEEKKLLAQLAEKHGHVVHEKRINVMFAVVPSYSWVMLIFGMKGILHINWRSLYYRELTAAAAVVAGGSAEIGDLMMLPVPPIMQTVVYVGFGAVIGISMLVAAYLMLPKEGKSVVSALVSRRKISSPPTSSATPQPSTAKDISKSKQD
jgi:hypothetical protein